MALVCASYELGHMVHGMHAIFSRRERRVPVVIAAADGVELSVTDGEATYRYRNHDIDRLLARIAATGGDLRLVPNRHLLVLRTDRSGELFSLASVEDELGACDLVPREPMTYPMYPPWGRLEGEGQDVKWVADPPVAR